MKWGRLVAVGVLFALVVQHQSSGAKQLELLTHIGPVVRSYLEMYGLKAALVPYLDENRRPPRSLPSWIDERFEARAGRPASVDMWGSRYMTTGQTGAYELRSCGPDTTCRNDDDLVLKLR